MSKRNENRPGYKKTKLGWLPSNWKVSTVGLSCQIKNELRLPLSTEVRKTIQGPYPYYGPTGILDHIDHYRIKGIYALIAEDGDHFLKFSTKPMTLLVSGSFNVNNHAHLVKGTNCCTTEWFFLFFLHRDIYQYITRQGAGRFKLNKAALKGIPLALPILSEQKKITKILSTWDAAVEQTRKLIAAKNRRKKALMLQLLTGKTKLKGFEEDNWEIVPLGRLVSPVSRPVPKPDKTYRSIGLRSHCKGTFHKFIDKPEKIMMDTLYRVEPEDLILNITFAWEGAIAFATEDDSGGLVSHRFPTFRLKSKIADIEFVRNLILTKRFIWDLGLISPGGAGRNRVMNKKDFLKIKVYVPSIKSQIKIGQVLSTANDEINQLEAKLKALEKQKRGLMQKLLTGEIRVIV